MSPGRQDVSKLRLRIAMSHFFIVPFHKWGVQRLISNAITAGRL
jgi:hypothetical protein